MAKKPVKKAAVKKTVKKKVETTILQDDVNRVIALLETIDAKLGLFYDKLDAAPTVVEQHDRELSQKQQAQKGVTVDAPIVEVVHKVDVDSVEVASNPVQTVEPKNFADPAPVLINQAGEPVQLTFEIVKDEAQLLCNYDKENKGGFYVARGIITKYGVQKLENLDPAQYPAIVAEFRKAVKEWK